LFYRERIEHSLVSSRLSRGCAKVLGNYFYEEERLFAAGKSSATTPPRRLLADNFVHRQAIVELPADSLRHRESELYSRGPTSVVLSPVFVTLSLSKGLCRSPSARNHQRCLVATIYVCNGFTKMEQSRFSLVSVVH
jgi:hypothetical protein